MNSWTEIRDRGSGIRNALRTRFGDFSQGLSGAVSARPARADARVRFPFCCAWGCSRCSSSSSSPSSCRAWAAATPWPAGGGADFGTILLPGLMAVAIMFSGIAAVALPLSQEFGITREIDDRVMCPLPLWAVALEKVCFSAMQSIIAALLVIPMAYYVPAAPVRADVHNWFLLALVLVLASLLAGSLGLVIGSTVNPKQIGLVFSIIVVPITFLGCVYYPWANLDKIRWLQIGVLFNPIVYMSEGLRAAVTPGIHTCPGGPSCWRWSSSPRRWAAGAARVFAQSAVVEGGLLRFEVFR